MLCLTDFPRVRGWGRPRWGVLLEGKLSMKARVEVTKRYAQAYADAPKHGKSLILDQVVEVTGWNRDHEPPQVWCRFLLS